MSDPTTVPFTSDLNKLDAYNRALWDAAQETGLEYSALSWSGFNIIGDRESIEEVQRLMMCEARLNSLEQRILDARVKL